MTRTGGSTSTNRTTASLHVERNGSRPRCHKPRTSTASSESEPHVPGICGRRQHQRVGVVGGDLEAHIPRDALAREHVSRDMLKVRGRWDPARVIGVRRVVRARRLEPVEHVVECVAAAAARLREGDLRHEVLCAGRRRLVYEASRILIRDDLIVRVRCY
jgi:hypothetical protein